MKTLLLQIQTDGGPSSGWTPACETSNPPHWCPDTPDANIDMLIGFGILIALIIGLSITLKKRKYQ